MKMKKSINLYLEPINVWLDEIESVVTYLSENSKGKIKIETSDYDIENINELKKIDEPTTSLLRIRTTDPYVSIELASYGSHIYGGDGSPTTVGICNILKERLEKNKKKFLILSEKIGKIILIPSLLSFFVLPYLIKTSKNFIIGSGFFLLISFILWVSPPFFSKTRIVLKYKKDEKNFFERNKDRLILIVISSILSFFVGRLSK